MGVENRQAVEQIRAGLEEGAAVPTVTRVPFGDWEQSLNRWLSRNGVLEKKTAHLGEGEFWTRLITLKETIPLVELLVDENWVDQQLAMRRRLPPSGAPTKGGMRGRPLVHLVVNRYRREDGQEVLLIERVQILRGPQRLKYGEELETRTELVELMGRWGKENGTPVYLIRPEVMRDVNPALSGRTIHRNYYEPVDQSNPRLWETVRLRVKESLSLSSEDQEDDWFHYVGDQPVKGQQSGGLEEAVQRVRDLLRRDGFIRSVYSEELFLTVSGERVPIERWVEEEGRLGLFVRNGPLLFLNAAYRTEERASVLQAEAGENLIWVEDLDKSDLGRRDLQFYTHTTLAALRRVPVQGKFIFDSGAGTGLSALVALRDGAPFVFLVEIDPKRLEQGVRNLELNGYQSGVHFHAMIGDIQKPEKIFEEFRKWGRSEQEWVLVSNIGAQKAYEVSNFQSIQLISGIEQATGARVVAFVGAGELIREEPEDRAPVMRDQEYLERKFRFEIDPDEVRFTDVRGVSVVAWIARRPPESGLEEVVSLGVNALRYADVETEVRSAGLKNY
jgi:hypothetical protein